MAKKVRLSSGIAELMKLQRRMKRDKEGESEGK